MRHTVFAGASMGCAWPSTTGVLLAWLSGSSCARWVVPEYDSPDGRHVESGTSASTGPGATPAESPQAGDASRLSDATRSGPVEVCDNGLDDNGDGAVDEGCACVPGARQRCYVGPASRAGAGLCVMGTQTCERAGAQIQWTACVGSGAPSSEICDGFDNDCNGLIDETCPCDSSLHTACYGGPPGTLGVGPCHAGVGTCSPIAGDVPQGTACEGMVRPAWEICDGVDNDCDGVVDNAARRCD